MDKVQKNLTICGLCLIVFGFVYGLGYTFWVEHKALLELKDAYSTTFLELTRDIRNNALDNGLLASVEEVGERSVHYRRAIGAHTHAINLGLLMILLGVLFPFAMSGTAKGRWVPYLFVAGTFVYPTGLALQAFGLVIAGEVFAILGSGSIVASIAVILIALLFRK